MRRREYFSQREYKTIGGFLRAVRRAVRKFFNDGDDILYTRLDTSMKKDPCFTVIVDENLLPMTVGDVLRKTGFVSFAESVRKSGKVVWKRGVEFDLENGIIYLYEHYDCEE